MEIAWLVLSCLVKLLFALSPALARRTDFNLGDFGYWKEAKEVATVAGTRGMMASLPVVLAIQTLEKAAEVCKPGGIEPLLTAVATLGLAGVTYGALRFPGRFLKGAILPFVLVVVLVAAEGGYTYGPRDIAASAMCASKVEAAKGAPAKDAPMGASTPTR